MPEQTLGGIPLGLEMVMKINFLNFHVLTTRVIACLKLFAASSNCFALNWIFPISVKTLGDRSMVWRRATPSAWLPRNDSTSAC